MQILERLGYTKNEIKIYNYLLENGSQRIGVLMNKLGISSSRVYVSLERLEKESLVVKIMINGKKYFQPNNPEVLIEKVENLKEETKNLVQNLKKKERIKDKDYSAVFKGINGFRSFYNTIGEIYDGKDEIVVIEFTKNIEHSNMVRNLILKLTKQRELTKTPLKIIINKKLKNTYGKIREKEEYINIKYLDSKEEFGSAFSVYKDYLVNILWDEEPIIYLIKNKEIANSNKKYFDLIWNSI